MKDRKKMVAEAGASNHNIGWKNALGEVLGAGLGEVLLLFGGGVTGLIIAAYGMVWLLVPFVVLLALGLRQIIGLKRRA